MQEVKRKSSELKREDIAKPKLNWRNTMTKWFLDCISVGAFFNTIAFLGLMGIMKGQSGSQIGDILRNVRFRMPLPPRQKIPELSSR